MQERYLSQRGPLIPEGTLWAFICQLVTALRAIHALDLACRVVHPLRILWTSPNRIRINCVGVLDVLESDSQKSLGALQQEDITRLGSVILSLATRLPMEHIQRMALPEVLEGIKNAYSVEVVSTKANGAAREWKYCSFDFYSFSLLQICFVVHCHSLLYLKHPNKPFF